MPAHIQSANTNISLIIQLKSLLKSIDRHMNIRSEDLVLMELLSSGNPFKLLPSELMDSVPLSSGAMTALIGRLKKGALNERIQDDKDARKHYVVLTQNGIDLASELMDHVDDKASYVIEALDDLEQMQVRKSLRKIEEKLNDK